MLKTKMITIILATIIAIFLWSPWMADDGGERTINKVIAEKSKEINNQITDEKGQILCDGMHSNWAPFGRLVSNCERNWYVTFWGKIF